MRLTRILLFVAATLSPASVHAQWESIDSGVTVNLYDIQFVDQLHGWAAGDSATVISTIDGGSTWTEQEIPASDFVYISYIQFLDSMTGYIKGKGRLKTQDPDLIGTYEEVFLRTVDGGTHWDPVPLVVDGIEPHVNQFYFFDSQTGWIAGSMERGGNDGIIAHTTNGGDTWTKQLQVTSLQYQLITVNFIDRLNGYALGGVIMDNFNETDLYHTVNGGADWETIYTFPSAKNSLITSAPNSLWLYQFGYDFSSDGSASWFSQPGISDGRTRDIDPTGPESAWILYNSDPDIVRHTSDGGQTFDYELPFENGVDSYAIDAVDNDGGLVIWVAGLNGALFRYRETVSATDDTVPKSSPVSVSAFPNPFNPRTTITYTLPASGHTHLAVYTVSGQKVADLVDRRQTAGTHRTVFDGSSVSSGVYIYRLETRGHHHTGKMLLMK